MCLIPNLLLLAVSAGFWNQAAAQAGPLVSSGTVVIKTEGTVSGTSPTTSASVSSASAAADDLAKFGDTVDILGQMERTDQDFTDGLALDLFSPKNRTVVVTQNFQPLDGRFISGSFGEPFVALSNYSYVVKVNETAQDLIAKIELPYDPDMISSMGFNIANTYVGTLAADKKSWVISESQRNVHVSENKTRIIKLTSLDGEYMLLGRNTADTSNIFVQYGQGTTRTVNVTGGPGRQEAEFVDGLRFSLESTQPFKLNADLVNGVDPKALPANSVSLNSFAWVINTTQQADATSEMLVPINPTMLSALTGGKTLRDVQVTVATRAVDDESGPFQPVPSDQQTVLSACDNAIKVTDLKKLDGQYVVLVLSSAGASPGASATGAVSNGNLRSSNVSTSAVPQVTSSPGSSIVFRRRVLVPAALGALVAPFR